MYRLSSLAGGAGIGVGRKQRVRLLRIYLSATTFLYAYGVVFTLFPVRSDIAYGNPTGGIIAILLGLAALTQLAIQSEHVMFPHRGCDRGDPCGDGLSRHDDRRVCLSHRSDVLGDVSAGLPPALPGVDADRGAHRGLCGCGRPCPPAPHVGVITFLIIVVAITAAAESFGLLMRAMFTAACTDPMTGLLNRAGWEIGTSDLLRHFRPTMSVSVVVVALDIDGLKTLNDTQGHQAGDRRITDYARQWKQLVPRRAVLARLGGDEFAVCIAGEDPGGSSGISSTASGRRHRRSASERPLRTCPAPTSPPCMHTPTPRCTRVAVVASKALTPSRTASRKPGSPGECSTK